jgi:hypothetical protein
MAISIEYHAAKNAENSFTRTESDADRIAARTAGFDITKRRKTPFNENAGADKTLGLRIK